MVATVAAILAVVITLQIPKVQTKLAEAVLKRISDRIDADIIFEKIHIKPVNTLVIKNIAIKDKNSPYGIDTLFSAKYIIARFSLKSLREEGGIGIYRTYVSDAKMNLVLEKSDTAENGRTNNITRMFRITPPDPDRPGRDIFKIRNVEVKNMDFRMVDSTDNDLKYTGGINWKNLHIKGIDLKGRHLELRNKIMTGIVDKLSFTERSGYACNSITGSARVGRGRAVIENIHIQDPWSDVSLPSFIMSYSCAKDFSEYTSKVRMDAEIDPSRLSMRTISYFAGGFYSGMEMLISGTVGGTVDDLNFRNLEITASGGSVRGTVNGRITGLPEVRKMYADIQLKDLSFGTRGLESVMKDWSRESVPDISRYAENGRFTLNGRICGLLNSLRLTSDISSNIGNMYASLEIGNLLSTRKALRINGRIKTEDLNINEIIGTEFLKECSLETGMTATLGKPGTDSEYAVLDIDSLKIGRLNMLNYNYTNIAATGTLAKNEFDGKIICNDPNLNFLFQGLFTISPKTNNALYKFYANVGYADLNALNIDKRDISKIRFQTSANFNRIGRGDMLGNIDIAGIILENSLGRHDIGRVTISSHSNDEVYRMKLESGFAEGSFVGTASIANFVKDLTDVTLKREIPAVFKDSSYVWNKNKYTFSFKTYNTIDLLDYLMPGLYISDNSSLKIDIDTSGIFNSSINSQRIAFKENYLKDISCTFDNRNGSLGGELNCGSISLVSMILLNNRIQMFADDNHVGIGFSYDNKSELDNRGEFNAICDISRTGNDSLRYDISLLPSNVYIDSQEWNIRHSEAAVSSGNIKVKNLEFQSGDQSVKLYGGVSATARDTLNLELDRFNISIFNPLIKKDIGLSFDITGRTRLISPSDERGLIMNLICDSTMIAGRKMGTVFLSSSWNDDYRRFDFRLRNNLAGRTNFDITGNLSPSIRRFEAVADIDSLDIGYMKPFIQEIFSGISGSVSGRFTAEGPVDRLKIGSENARLNNGELTVAYTNVPYKASGDFRLDEYGVYFDDIGISDRYGNNGLLYGNIAYDHFKNFEFNTRINVNRIECISLNEKDNESFYGNLFASGNMEITGPVSNLTMNVDAITTGSGQLHIPISNYTSAGSTNLLKFKEVEQIIEIDPYEEMMSRLKKQKQSSGGDFGIRLRVTATPEVEAFLEIDKSGNNVLNGRGSGIIELDIRPAKDIFNLKGNYTISSGNYKFVALGLASRDFTIQEGSSIRFNGDPMESTLNINALYKTKASLSTLIADTTSVSTRRTIDCGISITDKISNPRLSFSIDVPDIDPTVKSRVESALSTEDKVQKQFLSLIIFNSFIPDEQSGIVNNSSVLYSNVSSEIMSNQLNSIFQKLDIPLDLGLNYQPNDKGNDLFDVAVSTQLFNNRVVVNGNIGNRQYTTNNTSGDVVGDLDIEIKLDRPGAFRLNIFSHSADQYSNYLDNSQRNGMGLTYQHEFNSFADFFKKVFSKKQKREEMEQEAMREELNEKKKTVDIGKESRDSDKRKKNE